MSNLSLNLSRDNEINYSENNKVSAIQVRLELEKEIEIVSDKDNKACINNYPESNNEDDLCKNSSLTQYAKNIFISSALYKRKYQTTE